MPAELNVTAVEDDPEETVWSHMLPAVALPRTPLVVVCVTPLLFVQVIVSPMAVVIGSGEKKRLFILAV